MYRNDTLTPRFPEFGAPFCDGLNPNNRWIQLANIVPWDLVEKEYIKNSTGSTNGRPAVLARMAFGALLIQKHLDITDRETVLQIQENPYLQFLVGLDDFIKEEPFDPSMMVAFRKRLPVESINKINEAIALPASKSNDKTDVDHDDSDPEESVKDLEKKSSQAQKTEKSEPKNQGKLLMDATCTPADIRYPTDLNLLNTARKKSEQIIDRLHQELPQGTSKPRTYRIIAHKDYLKVVKKKSPSTRLIRKAIRKQLGYVRRNLKHIQTLAQTVSFKVLKKSLHRDLLVISELYRQQKIMYDTKQKRIDNRIVSIWFPHVRPIKRGKDREDTEFGAKIHVSLVNGFSFVEQISWENFNEGTDLITTVENYYRRFGFYPESVHADKIYRTKENRSFCQERGIRLSGPALGRPPKDKTIYNEQKKQIYQDQIDRIPIEGKFGQGKRRFGLGTIMAKLPSTSMTVIAMNFLVMNLEKLCRLGYGGGVFFQIIFALIKIYKALESDLKANWLPQRFCNLHR